MHTIEPYYNWRHLYTGEEDKLSPFYGREYSEFEFINTVFNYYIHPQWDDFGSRTLYAKILLADYEEQYAIVELIGEWNDAIENDIMDLKRTLIDKLLANGIAKFIFIVDNVYNFHSGDRDYYIELQEELYENEGWIVYLNFLPHNTDEFFKAKLNRYIHLLALPEWRTYKPFHLFKKVEEELNKNILGYLTG